MRTASLIQQARRSYQRGAGGQRLSFRQPARRLHGAAGLKPGDVHPVYKAMNTLDYVVGNIGSHEFNYGLDYLKNAIAGAKFVYINANVSFHAKTQNRCSRRTSSSIRR
ncbi:hypothetical protein J4732_02050 [Serratia marcescens]|uniref:Trifunctional nucleotide phosphoesterase protein YfkN n=1 Tax=Serratia marcescens TaxID=615 RepID=A0A939NR45_SERMA|nr:hypothetical protein [Serratia marcescens]